ncbi:Phosphopantetheine attachment site [Proteiniborus ethanoligenes]|uniref:Phosphopantetheine attachment site n=1 Tax=Proteiniborus ethanoligenes TaxID=415015 RepID=A0A1H3QAF3_9FIRM|nr:phosphopantetheine-binding protein [Proteiniborus ethanoligenes]TAH63203.1 MAG: acyl carrier protein [Gottschalkiaceae bacterium]SDZ10243.1 Phosphopantetheine attachment site [Proteiniborus ethanoligenes]
METLLEILEELHPDVDFENCDTLIDSNILDSFDIIAIISEINSEFDVAIPAEEIIPENFNSAKALYALIERLSDEY